MESYILSKDDRDAILRYLMGRPYGEVTQAVNVLMKWPKLDPKINPSFVQSDDKSKSK